MNQTEIRQQITDKILIALATPGKLPPWKKQWQTSKNTGSPRNIVSGRKYSGINTLILALHQDEHNLSSCWYGTFNQWSKLRGRIKSRPMNGSVPPGNWAAKIVFYNVISKYYFNNLTKLEEEVSFPILKWHYIFNIDQVESSHLDEYRADKEIIAPNQFYVDKKIDDFILNIGVEIKYEGSQAFYRPSTDSITLPPPEQFNSYEDFVSVLCHEMGHWTAKRIGWEPKNYAENELMAEITSSYLMNELGVLQSTNLELNHHAYISSWIQHLQNDNRFIFRASTAASKAVDYLLNKAGILEKLEELVVS